MEYSREIIKIILIFTLVLLITIILVKSSNPKSNSSSIKECYYASMDDTMIDPRVHPYSKDITFRPDSDDDPDDNYNKYGKTITAGLVNYDVPNKFENQIDSVGSLNINVPDHMSHDPTKVFTHLDNQDAGLNDYDNTVDTDDFKNVIKQRQDDLYRHTGYDPQGLRGNNKPLRLIKKINRLRDMREALTNVGKHINNDRIFMPDVERDIKKVSDVERFSSYYNTDINGYVIRETNNIANTCANKNFYVGSMLDTKADVPLLDGDIIDFPFSDQIDKVDNPTMSDDDYSSELKRSTGLKIFVKDVSKCKIDDMEECEKGLDYEDMDTVIDRYRLNTFNAYRGCYRNNSCTAASQNGMLMYDRVD